MDVFETGFFTAVPAALAGLLLGSFLNVCIYRWPLEKSVVHPRSYCPGCERGIAWFDNVPVLSYLLLKGRCRHCRVRISWRYPVVEILVSACFAWYAARYGFTPETLRGCVFAFLLIGLTFADLETMLLPDELTFGGAVAGLAFSLAVPVPDSTFSLIAASAGVEVSPRLVSLGESALGAAIPSLAMWLMGVAFEKLRHKEGLGFGDVKMIAMIGSFLGLTGTLQTVILASLGGSICGLIWIKVANKSADTYLPFGTSLGAAALVTAMGGQGWFWALAGGNR